MKKNEDSKNINDQSQNNVFFKKYKWHILGLMGLLFTVATFSTICYFKDDIIFHFRCYKFFAKAVEHVDSVTQKFSQINKTISSQDSYVYFNIFEPGNWLDSKVSIV